MPLQAPPLAATPTATPGIITRGSWPPAGSLLAVPHSMPSVPSAATPPQPLSSLCKLSLPSYPLSTRAHQKVDGGLDAGGGGVDANRDLAQYACHRFGGVCRQPDLPQRQRDRCASAAGTGRRWVASRDSCRHRERGILRHAGKPPCLPLRCRRAGVTAAGVEARRHRQLGAGRQAGRRRPAGKARQPRSTARRAEQSAQDMRAGRHNTAPCRAAGVRPLSDVPLPTPTPRRAAHGSLLASVSAELLLSVSAWVCTASSAPIVCSTCTVGRGRRAVHR